MENKEIVITNEIVTNAETEEELIKIFNDKLATIILHLETKKD